MITITVDILAANMAVEFEKLYPDDEFLEDELYSIIQAVFTSLKWAALRKWEENAKLEVESESVLTLENVDHFTSRWLTREEIIDRIMFTSGLDEEKSKYALQIIEKIIDEKFEQHEESVLVEDIGMLKMPNPPGYFIKLSKWLTTSPGSQFHFGGSAAGA